MKIYLFGLDLGPSFNTESVLKTDIMKMAFENVSQKSESGMFGDFY